MYIFFSPMKVNDFNSFFPFYFCWVWCFTWDKLFSYNFFLKFLDLHPPPECIFCV